VRSFRVAGIRGLLGSDEVLTIQTAVRLAMEYQTRGLEAQAEFIYRSILHESPLHADALHLLGVIFYQKGDAQSAVPYIERALMSNSSFEGFHNSLG
jgi:protein O-GlcNAc transferase